MSAQSQSPEVVVRDIKRQTRKRYSAEERIRIVLEGLKGEASIAEICRREGINTNVYCEWSKDFLEAGKKRLLGDTVREATSTEVIDLKKENDQLKLIEKGSSSHRMRPALVRSSRRTTSGSTRSSWRRRTRAAVAS
jgi:transposase